MRVEMKKMGNPFNEGKFERNNYYTDVKFELFGKKIEALFKIDTGASYTVVGLSNECVTRFKDKILRTGLKGTAYDASDSTLNLKGIVVQNFEVADRVTIPELLIFFSEELGTKAVLGMDILSLFNFQYVQERGYNCGTFWLNNPEESLDKMLLNMKKKGLSYIDPVNILEIDNIDSGDSKIQISSLLQATEYVIPK